MSEPAYEWTEDHKILAPHQLRVVEEAHDLAEKHGKLGLFLLSPTMATLSHDEQTLLREQWDAMGTYLRILGMRLSGFRAVEGPAP